ncbi:hypothetical protein L204_104471 [Cryptococcus depauperatus]
MPTPLTRQTESFNSSTATIVPESRKRAGPARNTRSRTSYAKHQPRQEIVSAQSVPPDAHTLSLSQTSQSAHYDIRNVPARMLRPQDSLERRINSAIGVEGGDDGLIGLLTTQDVPHNPLSGWSFLKDSQPSDVEDIQNQALDAETFLKEMDVDKEGFAAFSPSLSSLSNMPTSPFDHGLAPSPQQAHDHRHQQAYENYRPDTAMSWHSGTEGSLDNSDLYSTTDIDTEEDEGFPRPVLGKSNDNDLGLGSMNIDHTDVPSSTLNSPLYEMTSHVSPQDLHGDSPLLKPVTFKHHLLIQNNVGHEQIKAGRHDIYRKGKTGVKIEELRAFGISQEEQKRKERLEHRRDINRRSAQKHRLRRKEEIESMQRQISSREARIREVYALILDWCFQAGLFGPNSVHPT